MGKSFIILALLSLSICQGCSNKQKVGAKVHQGKARTYDNTPRRSDSTNENRQSLKKYALKTFRRYQTFDEFKMKGVGKPIYSPFVYVKTTKDTMIVIPSNDTTHVKVYHRQGNRWRNHIELELWKKRQPFTKSSLEEPARTYDRICGNDTILEYQCNYLGNTKYKQFYIKTPKRCVNIKLIGEIDFVSGNHTVYNEMLMFAHMFNHESVGATRPVEIRQERGLQLFFAGERSCLCVSMSGKKWNAILLKDKLGNIRHTARYRKIWQRALPSSRILVMN